MKRVGIAAALLLVFGASAAEADRWVSGKQLPKPVDYPVVRKKVQEGHKPGKKQHHPPDASGGVLPAI
jgi:hypothetical protein